MDNFDLLNYIGNKSSDPDLFAIMNYELKGNIYQYGDNFKNNRENLNKWKKFLRYSLEFLYFSFPRRKQDLKNKKILSSSYFTYDKYLKDLGYSVYRAPWSLKTGMDVAASQKLFFQTKNIQNKFYCNDFNTLISNDFLEVMNEFYLLWKKVITQYSFDALVVPFDVGFFERITIKIFKELGRPSFIFAHGGMPSIYDGIMENRTDYYFMWGQKPIDAYVKMGYDPKKFYVCGHPFYKKEPKSFRFSLESVLVLNKNINGVSPAEEIHLDDRGKAILYLYSIQNTLSKLGVKKARLRLHPSQNPKWYKRFIDTSFFQIEEGDLQSSLSKSSLVIGPTSTTIIDAMANELNYLIYEPAINDTTLVWGYPISPPLDDTDPRIPVARNEDDLFHFLKNGIKLDISVYKEFAKTPFDISFIKDII